MKKRYMIIIFVVLNIFYSCEKKREEYPTLDIPDFKPYKYVKYDENMPYGKALDLSIEEVRKKGLSCNNISIKVFDGKSLMSDCMKWYLKIVNDKDIVKRCEEISNNFGKETEKALLGCNRSEKIIKEYCEQVFGNLNQKDSALVVEFLCRKDSLKRSYSVIIDTESLSVVSSTFIDGDSK